ncbi:hypothetical protein [Ralstonia solanacearum]|uniref:hypothetical protein n=1 Tax=Ralstonia solanacearum TaxID=305 RepID=UPI00399D6A6A
MTPLRKAAVTGDRRVTPKADKPEMTVLSPHEFAVLLLVNDSAEACELDRADIETLVERQLVTLERRGPNHSYAQLTIQGHLFLKACGHAQARVRARASANAR